jgi:hypothetical protein
MLQILFTRVIVFKVLWRDCISRGLILFTRADTRAHASTMFSG